MICAGAMVADPSRRALLHDMDRAVGDVRTHLGDEAAAALAPTGTYHDRVRM